DIILDLYRFSNEYPWPEIWLAQQQKSYELEPDVTEDELPWLHMLKNHVREELEGYIERAEKAIEIAREPDGPDQYITALEDDIEKISTGLSKVSNWEDLQAYMAEMQFSRLSGKRTECNADKKEAVQAIRNKYKDEMGKLTDELFKRNLDGHLKDMRKLAPAIKQLTALVTDFKERFTAVKREKAIVDFSDLEHFCLEILLDPASTPDKMIPSEV